MSTAKAISAPHPRSWEIAAARSALRLLACLCLQLTTDFTAGAHAAEPVERPLEQFLGQPVHAIVEHYRRAGLPFVYSTNLVTEQMRVESRPVARDPVPVVAEILAAHGLEIREIEDVLLIVRSAATGEKDSASRATVYFIVRDAERQQAVEGVQFAADGRRNSGEHLGRGTYRLQVPADRQVDLTLSAAGFIAQHQLLELESGSTRVLPLELALGPAQLHDLTISTSRYHLSRELLNSILFFDQRAIQGLPDVGDDPIRAVQRLPGTAAGGFSAKAHFRGGEQGETAIFLNGLRLLDPFHIRDYQSIFSAIDVRAIEGIEVYTGGFPVEYGDRMSGLVLIDAQEPEKPRRTEIGLSTFNTSILSTGYLARSQFDWLVSARSSNLDLVLDQSVGEPSYEDVFAQAGFRLGADTRLSLNTLVARDSVLVVTENDITEREESRSDTRNLHLWAVLDHAWTRRILGATLLSYSTFRNARIATFNDPEQLLANVDDFRTIDTIGFHQDWQMAADQRHYLTWGVSAESAKAVYDYSALARYFGFKAAYSGQPGTVQRAVKAQPRGDSYGAYVSDRWRLSDRTTAELGLRWDAQTYTSAGTDTQLSPRFSLLHAHNSKLDLRLSWGRFYQSQGIHELQVEDGQQHYFPAQRADHLIAGIHYRFGDAYALRLEVFDKDFSLLKPRFENLYDSLALLPELQPDRIMIRPDSSRSRGAEISLDYRGPHDLRWWAGYTLARTTDRIDGLDVPRSWDQRHALQAGLSWNRGPWEFGAAFSYRSGWPTSELQLEVIDEENYVLTPGGRNTLRLGHFSSLDLRLSREFKVRPGKLTAFFELSNSLDRKNPCCLDYDLADSPGDSIELDRSIDYWLPVIPALGVLWEF